MQENPWSSYRPAARLEFRDLFFAYQHRVNTLAWRDLYLARPDRGYFRYISEYRWGARFGPFRSAKWQPAAKMILLDGQLAAAFYYRRRTRQSWVAFDYLIVDRSLPDCHRLRLAAVQAMKRAMCDNLWSQMLTVVCADDRESCAFLEGCGFVPLRLLAIRPDLRAYSFSTDVCRS